MLANLKENSISLSSSRQTRSKQARDDSQKMNNDLGSVILKIVETGLLQHVVINKYFDGFRYSNLGRLPQQMGDMTADNNASIGACLSH
jgi:hypothetical protein